MKKLLHVLIFMLGMSMLNAQPASRGNNNTDVYKNANNYIVNSFDPLEPGVLPEADLPYKVEYSPDGEKLIVIYHHTDNMIIYDAETKDPLATVDVGECPVDFEVVGDHIYICCYYSNEVYRVNLDSYEIEQIYEVDPNPCVIHVRSDEDLMYIGFTADSPEREEGYIAAWVLADNNRLWENSEAMIGQQSEDGSWGRIIRTISDFLLIADDQYIVCDRNAGSHLLIINSISGQIDSLIYQMGRSISYTTSPGKDTLYLLTSVTDSLRFYCIDAFTFTILDQMTIPVSGSPSFYGWQDNLSVNGNGTKLFIETTSFPDNYSYLVDLQNDEFEVLQPEGMIFIIRRKIQSYDHRYVLVPGSNLRIFDFQAEEYVYETSDFLKLSNNLIAASPVEYEFVYSDHSFQVGDYYLDYYEYFEVYDFTNPQNPEITDSIFCGEQPEADMVYSADINHSCNKLVTANPLSRNISIIDYGSYELDTLIDIDNITSVKSLPGNLIAMTGHRNPGLYFYDLSTFSVVRQFDVEGLTDMTLSPDNEYLYALSMWLGKMMKIHLDGSNSTLVDSVNVKVSGAGFNGIDWAYYPELTPDGNYFISYDDDTARIISTELMEIVGNVPNSGMSFHDLAYTDDSKRACLASRQYVEIIYLDGANSYMEHTIVVGVENRSMVVEFNSQDKNFYVATDDSVLVVDPVSGMIKDSLYFGAKDPQIQIGFDHNSVPIIRTFHNLYYKGQEYSFRETTKDFFVDYTNKNCIIPSPGPDKVYILDLLTTEMEEINVGDKKDYVCIYPNPANEFIDIKSEKMINRVKIYGINGNLLYAENINAQYSTVSLTDFPQGVYLLAVRTGGKWINKKLLISR